ncbi:hypothetical protein WBP_1026 [Wolbachia endosymbiont of Brugia pahangi]|nr:hypothetical protein WBP_1026 [Wolbachia endosymbiont of Brugia pahangi]
MVGVKGFRDLLSKIRLAWVSLILSVKNFFSSNKHTPLSTSIKKQNADNGCDSIQKKQA